MPPSIQKSRYSYYQEIESLEEIHPVFQQSPAVLEYWKNADLILSYVLLNEDNTDQMQRFDKVWKTSCDSAEMGAALL